MKAYLELGELKQLEEVARCLRDRLLIHIMFHLGLRVSEALALRIEYGKISCLGNHYWYKKLLKKEKESR